MKKRLLAALAAGAVLASLLTGCGGKKTLLDPADPVTLTMWHVYGEQAESPMNTLVEEFNKTVGREKGIVLDVTAMTNSTKIGQELLDAQAQKPGAPEMPDLFFCHTDNAAALGAEALIDWNTLFSKKELGDYVDAFVQEGTIDGRLTVFPVSKSTHLLFLNGSRFGRFAAQTGASYDDLATWDGFYKTAAAFAAWSGGEPFCAFDYPLRTIQLDAESAGRSVMTADGWYDFTSEALHTAWLRFARALAQGQVVLSDLYSNTHVMTGETLGGISSSAAILYYNDTVTYADNTSEPIDLHILPLPQDPGGTALATQAGVGLCALKTTGRKAEAAGVFARWLTESERNLSFVTQTGYMPVRRGAFDAIDSHVFSSDAYRGLYQALQTVNKTCALREEPGGAGYYTRVNALYDALRRLQPELQARCLAGESPDALAEETWQLFQSIQ